jgi:hypothetical protein
MREIDPRDCAGGWADTDDYIRREIARRADALDRDITEALLPLLGEDREEFERLCVRAKEGGGVEAGQAIAELVKKHDINCISVISEGTRSRWQIPHIKFVIRQHGVIVAVISQ